MLLYDVYVHQCNHIADRIMVCDDEPQTTSHRMMHYTVVNSVQAAWHPKQWCQQYWRNPVQPIAICSDRAAEEKQDFAGKSPAMTYLPRLNSLLCCE